MSTTATGITYTKKERVLVGLSAMFGYGLDFYNLIIIAFLFAPIQHTLHITDAQVGVIISMTLAASFIGGILIGYVGDKIGRKNALLFTLILLAAGAILSVFAWNFTSLLVFRFIAGVGVGGEWGAGIVLFNEVWDSRRRGLGSGVISAMAGAGTALASVTAAFALAHFTPDIAWRVAMGLGGLPLLLMPLVRVLMPESRQWQEFDDLKRSGQLKNRVTATRDPLSQIVRGAFGRTFLLGVAVAGGYIIAYQSATTFIPLLMTRTLGATPVDVRNVQLFWALAFAIGAIGTGYLSDIMGRRLSVMFATIAGAAGLLAIYATGDAHYGGSLLSWSLFWTYLFWGLGQGAAGQMGPWFAELYPVELRTTATSTIYTTGRLVGAVAPFAVPLLAASMGGLLNGIMFGLVGSALSLVAALMISETAGRKLDITEVYEVSDTETTATPLAVAAARH